MTHVIQKTVLKAFFVMLFACVSQLALAQGGTNFNPAPGAQFHYAVLDNFIETNATFFNFKTEQECLQAIDNITSAYNNVDDKSAGLKTAQGLVLLSIRKNLSSGLTTQDSFFGALRKLYESPTQLDGGLYTNSDVMAIPLEILTLITN